MTLSEQLLARVDRALTRRQFLAKLSGVTLGLVLYLITPPVSQAYVVAKCCNLCKPPGSPCNYPHCDGSNNQAQSTQWCWYCIHSDGLCYKCCECLKPNSPCRAPDSQECDNNVTASYLVYAGRYCQGASSGEG